MASRPVSLVTVPNRVAVVAVMRISETATMLPTPAAMRGCGLGVGLGVGQVITAGVRLEWAPTNAEQAAPRIGQSQY